MTTIRALAAALIAVVMVLGGCGSQDPRAENDLAVIEILSGWWNTLSIPEQFDECDAYIDRDATQRLTMTTSMTDATDGEYFLWQETYDLFFTKVCEPLGYSIEETS